MYFILGPSAHFSEVQIIGLADVLLDAEQDVDAMSLLVEAQEAANLLALGYFDLE